MTRKLGESASGVWGETHSSPRRDVRRKLAAWNGQVESKMNNTENCFPRPFRENHCLLEGCLPFSMKDEARNIWIHLRVFPLSPTPIAGIEVTTHKQSERGHRMYGWWERVTQCGTPSEAGVKKTILSMDFENIFYLKFPRRWIFISE